MKRPTVVSRSERGAAESRILNDPIAQACDATARQILDRPSDEARTIVAKLIEDRAMLLDAARRVYETGRHHADCDPLSTVGCRCGRWKLGEVLRLVDAAR